MGLMADHQAMNSRNQILDDAVLIRSSLACDEPALRRLAALDSAPPLRGHAVVAEARGELIAARCLATGREIADPFRPTADALQLLRLRADAQPARGRRGLRVVARRVATGTP